MNLPIVAVTGSVETKIPLPVIPLYDLSLAAQLIPCTVRTLYFHLGKRKENHPAVYRREKSGRRIRLLTAHEIVSMRTYVLRGPGLRKVLGVYPDMSEPTREPQPPTST